MALGKALAPDWSIGLVRLAGGATTFAGRGPSAKGYGTARAPRPTSRSTGRRLRLTNLEKVLVPRDRLHQRSGGRLLRPGRPDDAPAPRRPPAHDGAPPRRRSTASGSSRSAAPATVPSGSPPFRSTPTPTSRRARSRRSPGSCGPPTSPRWSCTPRRPRPTTRGTRPRWSSTSTRARRPTSSTARVVALDLHDLLDQLGLRVGREDVGLEGPPPLGRAAAGRPTPRRRRASRSRSGSILERRDPKHVTVTMARDQRPEPRVRRLEPERPPQDDGVRVLAARDTGAGRVDAAVVGRGRRPSPTATRRAGTLHARPTCSTASHELGDLYADRLAQDQELPQLAQ